MGQQVLKEIVLLSVVLPKEQFLKHHSVQPAQLQEYSWLNLVVCFLEPKTLTIQFCFDLLLAICLWRKFALYFLIIKEKALLNFFCPFFLLRVQCKINRL